MNRDTIARIIDPEGWEKFNSLPANYRGPVVLPPTDALAKADAILALPVRGGVEDLAQALQDFADEREPQIFLTPHECEAIVEWFAAL